MKLVNPLYYPVAVTVGAIVLLAGVRLVNLPRFAMLPVAVAVATAGAMLLKAREPETLGLENPELERELQAVRQQANALAERSDALRLEAGRLLSRADQVELLGTVQYACDRAVELPAKVDQLVQRMQGADSLLSVAELQQQLSDVQTKLASSSGAAEAQLIQLSESLQRNLQLAQQGQDARQAQIVNLSTLIQDAGGVLQDLQNKLRTADLTNAAEATALRSLSDEFKRFQDTVELLVS